MKTSIKAVLLSAFVCPGAGHFYLKKMTTGKLILVTAIAALSYLCWHAYQKAQLISEKIISGEIPLQLDAIYSAVTQAPVGNEALWINIATAAFVLSWLFGIADSYRLGRQQDKQES